MDVWWSSTDWIVFRVCSITLFFLFFGVFHHPIRCGYDWPPQGVCITWGSWWPMINPFSLLRRTCLEHPGRSLLLGVMLFAGRAPWTHEPLDSGHLVGSEVLHNYYPSCIWMSAVGGTVVTMSQRRKRDKPSLMIIHHLSYQVLDLYVSIVITVNYTLLRSYVVFIYLRVDRVRFRLTYYYDASKEICIHFWIYIILWWRSYQVAYKNISSN